MVKTVIICGDCGDKTLTREIVRICSNNGGALVCDGDRIYQTTDDPFFLIFSMCTLSDIFLPGSIVVLGKALIQIRQDMDLSDCVCIIDGENRDSAVFAASFGGDTVGCSMSGHDTLTISGFNGDGTAVAALRRRIGEYEPGEYIVDRYDRDNMYPVLAGTAVLLLSGKL